MEISWLHQLIVLEEIGSFQKAADELYISQSTLSKHIMSIENELNALIFDRSRKSLKLTPFGVTFLPYAKKIVNIQNEYTTKLVQPLKQKENSVVIGASYSQAVYNLIELVNNFEFQYPEFHIEVQEIVSQNLLSKLRKKEIDFALMWDYHFEQTDDVSQFVHAKDTVVAVVPATHALADRTEVTFKELEDEIFIRKMGGNVSNQILDNLLNTYNITPITTQTTGKLTSILSMVSLEKGIYISTKHKIEYFQKLFPNIHILDLVPEVSFNLLLLHLKNRRMNKASEQFLTYMKALSVY